MHVCMVAFSDLRFDSRIFREATALRATGHRVSIVAASFGTDPLRGWEGFEVSSVQRMEEAYGRTQIWDFTTTSKGSPLPRLMHLYQRYASDVIFHPNPDRAIDFRVILGADYDPCLSAKLRWSPEGDEPLPTATPLPTPIPTPAH